MKRENVSDKQMCYFTLNVNKFSTISPHLFLSTCVSQPLISIFVIDLTGVVQGCRQAFSNVFVHKTLINMQLEP